MGFLGYFAVAAIVGFNAWIWGGNFKTFIDNDERMDALEHVSKDFISQMPDNNTMVLTTLNSTDTFETDLFWNQVKTFQSQGWNITDIVVIDDHKDRTEVTLVR